MRPVTAVSTTSIGFIIATVAAVRLMVNVSGAGTLQVTGEKMFQIPRLLDQTCRWGNGDGVRRQQLQQRGDEGFEHSGGQQRLVRRFSRGLRQMK